MIECVLSTSSPRERDDDDDQMCYAVWISPLWKMRRAMNCNVLDSTIISSKPTIRSNERKKKEQPEQTHAKKMKIMGDDGTKKEPHSGYAHPEHYTHIWQRQRWWW